MPARPAPVSPLLRLDRFDHRMAVAFERGLEHFGICLGARVPDGWPQYPAAFTATSVRSDGWGNYVLLSSDAERIVGHAGFKGPPGDDGMVEIGYEVAPGFRRMGMARAAAAALVSWAFYDPRVLGVQAHTLVRDTASSGVLQRLGFERRHTLVHPTLGVIQRWRVSDTPRRGS